MGLPPSDDRHEPAGVDLSGRRSYGRLRDHVAPYLGGQRWRLTVSAGSTLLGGLGDAFVLYLVVLLATALAGGDSSIDVALGPVEVDALGWGQVLGGALVALAISAALAVVAAAVAARMSMIALVRARQRTWPPSWPAAGRSSPASARVTSRSF